MEMELVERTAEMVSYRIKLANRSSAENHNKHSLFLLAKFLNIEFDRNSFEILVEWNEKQIKTRRSDGKCRMNRRTK